MPNVGYVFAIIFLEENISDKHISLTWKTHTKILDATFIPSPDYSAMWPILMPYSKCSPLMFDELNRHITKELLVYTGLP